MDPRHTAEVVSGLVYLTQLSEIDELDTAYSQQRKAMDAIRPRAFKSCVRCDAVTVADYCECGSVCFNHHCLNASELLAILDGEESDDVKLARFNAMYDKEEAEDRASTKKEAKDVPLNRDEPFPAPILTGLKVRRR